MIDEGSRLIMTWLAELSPRDISALQWNYIWTMSSLNRILSLLQTSEPTHSRAEIASGRDHFRARFRPSPSYRAGSTSWSIRDWPHLTKSMLQWFAHVMNLFSVGSPIWSLLFDSCDSQISPPALYYLQFRYKKGFGKSYGPMNDDANTGQTLSRSS
jgi:hypothetical protein